MGGYYVTVDQMEQKEWSEDAPLTFVEIEQLREQYPIPSAFAAFKKYLDEKWLKVK